MVRNDFYKYKIIGLPVIMYKKLYMDMEFLNYFHFFSLQVKGVKSINECLYNSFNSLNQSIFYFDYFNLFSSTFNQFSIISRSNFIGNFSTFFFRFFKNSKEWNLAFWDKSWYLNLLLSYNSLNKNYFFTINITDINRYFKQFFLFFWHFNWKKIYSKIFFYSKKKLLNKNINFIFNNFKISLHYLKNFLNIDLYTLKYLILFQLIIRWSLNMELFTKKIWKNTLFFFAQKKIRKYFSRFLHVKNYFIKKGYNYLSKYQIVYRKYKRKWYYKFFSILFILIKKFYLFYQKLLWNNNSINIITKFEIVYFNILQYLIKTYKIFFLKRIYYKRKRYYRKFFYFFFLKLWIHLNVFKVLKKKNNFNKYKYYMLIYNKFKSTFFINLFKKFIKYCIYNRYELKKKFNLDIIIYKYSKNIKIN